MNKENLILKFLEMLLSSDSKDSFGQDKIESTKPMVGEYCIIRCCDAGVRSRLNSNTTDQIYH